MQLFKKKEKKSSLYYRILHQKNKPPIPLLFAEVFLATLFYMVWIPVKIIFTVISLALVAAATGGIFGIEKIQSLEIYLDFFPMAVRICYLVLIIIAILYLCISKKMFILGFLVAGAIFFTGNTIYDKYYPIYQDYDEYAKRVAEDSRVADFWINESSTIYDIHNKKIATLKENADMRYLYYDEIPDDVVNAYVAIEDRTFWDNDGVDYYGIMRVIYNYVVSHGTEEHGASTITQQLVRNIYLTHEVSMERKIKEILIARHLTKKYPKQNLMEFYINDICYANGIYGIAGASKAYFDKSVDDLTLSETAYLCAIPNSPTYYDPYKYPERAVTRRNKILKDMLGCGFITQKEYDDAVQEDIIVKSPKDSFNDYETTFAVNSIVKYFMKRDGFEFRYEFDDMDDYRLYHSLYDEAYEKERHELYTGGYTVYTTLDLELYDKMQEMLDKNLEFDTELDENTGVYALQGAATIIDNSNGKVIAVVGGRSQQNSVYSFNRAFQSYRQPGSSFKPIATYTPAIMKGYSPESIVENIDVSKAKEKGVIVQELEGDKLTLREAVEKSLNGVAWKIFDAITPYYGMSFPVAMEYSNLCPSDYYNASSLGGLTYGVTTLEQASGYSTLSNHGVFREPTCIYSITDTDGNEIYEEYDEKEVYSSSAADTMVDILKGVLIRGTAAKLGWSSLTDTEAFAKTGTTNSSKDGWLCGATPYYSIVVWVGYDQPKELSNLYGATYPGQIWRDMMYELVKDKDTAVFTMSVSTETEIQNRAGGYYSYLEGRDDSEILAEGYTVADYRNDRVIGESVQEIIDQISNYGIQQDGAMDDITELYNQGLATIDTIYSQNYSEEMKSKLETAYKEAITKAEGNLSEENNPAETAPDNNEGAQ